MKTKDGINIGGRPSILKTLDQVKEVYDGSIIRSSTPGLCHEWKEPNSLQEITLWNEEGVLVASHVWGYEKKYGRLSRGKVVWRVCRNYRCHNEQHWIVDRALSHREKNEIRREVRVNKEKVSEVAQAHKISLALAGTVLAYKDVF